MNKSALPRTGEKVTLRRLHLLDLAAFQSYRHDAELGQYQGWSAQSDEESAEFISEMSGAALFVPGIWVQVGIADRVSNSLVGDIGICVSADGTAAEIGFTLDSKAQGQGFATEAVRETIALLFETTAVAKVVGITDQRNISSIKLLERIGMQRVETVETLFRGLPCVEYTYMALRE
ncbi:GNAT family N-acetyltransferase [Roseateles oligotrophus]|uniref:GNAT family N-acetyltransferase n=1 Tax=Roseateles oligotrophus TaxID=1769250 RepID=A0ABT2YI30_9BURK|nr:GNAT family N-acetyltransferase [Roseateles oligotrophus]MCV2369673.1 GNAT family N-acetyltransferase [Roseateles oligotrophus]